MLNTKIVAAQRNRPASMGAKAHEPFGTEPVSFGVDPSHCGRRVREAILANELYAFAGIPKGHEGGLKAGSCPAAQALVDAIDAGVVDEEPVAMGDVAPPVSASNVSHIDSRVDAKTTRSSVASDERRGRADGLVAGLDEAARAGVAGEARTIRFIM